MVVQIAHVAGEHHRGDSYLCKRSGIALGHRSVALHQALGGNRVIAGSDIPQQGETLVAQQLYAVALSDALGADKALHIAQLREIRHEDTRAQILQLAAREQHKHNRTFVVLNVLGGIQRQQSGGLQHCGHTAGIVVGTGEEAGVSLDTHMVQMCADHDVLIPQFIVMSGQHTHHIGGSGVGTVFCIDIDFKTLAQMERMRVRLTVGLLIVALITSMAIMVPQHVMISGIHFCIVILSASQMTL